MARRASSRVHGGWLALLAALVLVAAAGGYALFRFGSDPFRTLPALEIEAYRESADSLRGNEYKVRGTVDRALGWHPKEGRLLSIEIEGAREPEPLPVLVPAEFNHINVQRGQRFDLRVTVVRDGVVLVKDMRKS